MQGSTAKQYAGLLSDLQSQLLQRLVLGALMTQVAEVNRCSNAVNRFFAPVIALPNRISDREQLRTVHT